MSVEMGLSMLAKCAQYQKHRVPWAVRLCKRTTGDSGDCTSSSLSTGDIFIITATGEYGHMGPCELSLTFPIFWAM